MAVPSPPFPSSKPALRRQGLDARRAAARSLSPETRAALEGALADRVLPHLIEARAIAAYHPLKDEVSPYPLLERLGAGQRVGFPWFAERDSKMIWREGPAVEASPWGVLQPQAGAAPIVPDIVLVPLVLVDRRGTRVGHGKGHYDRALSHLREAGPVFTIGLGWDEQIVEGPLPADPWDVALDAVASPREWISCR